MFFPEVLAPDARLAFSLPHEDLWFGHLHAVRFRAQARAPRGTLLYWHGNAGSLRTWGEVGAQIAAQFPWDVVVVDYAGYGKSGGTIDAVDERSMLADAHSVFDALHTESAVGAFGRSLGTGVATFLAATRPVERLVLETPYASIVDVARRLLPRPLQWAAAGAVKIQLRSDVWMRDVTCPVHVMHGTDDRVIPLASAEVLRPMLPKDNSSTFTVIPGGGHSDLARFPAYREALQRALSV